MPHAMDLPGAPATALPRPGGDRADTLGAETARLAPAHIVAPQYRFFAAGSELFAQDEPIREVFTVVEGWIGLHHSLEDGRRQILDFLLPGDICGLAPFAGGPASHTAEALTDVTVTALPRARFASMLASDAAHAAAVIERLADTVSAAYDSLVDTGRRNATEALAHLLLRLDRRIRAAGGAAPGARVDFPLTQEQIGDAVGLSAAHVCRTLRVLRERGILSLCRQRLQIHDPSALCRMVGTDGPKAFRPRDLSGAPAKEYFKRANRESNHVAEEHSRPRRRQ